jgi:spoIIIJ-associated protein
MSDELVASNIDENIDEFVNTVIELSGLDLRAEVSFRQESLSVELTGEDVPLLLGRNGELLNAMEYLANKVYGRQMPNESKICFDSEGFRQTRERELQLMAMHAAERVRVSKRPFSFEPMSPSERRIVHLALAEQAGVRTESHGEGEDRKVTVYPAD